MNGAELGCGRPPQQSFPVACSYASTRWFKANSPLGHIGNSCARAFPRKPGHTKYSVEQDPLRHGPRDCEDLCVVHARDPHPDARAVRLDDLVITQIN